MEISDSSPGQGKLFVVGIGPGHKLDRTLRAEAAISASEVIVGYPRYMQHIQDLTLDKNLICSGMRREYERCTAAIEQAEQGKIVALVSSGDSGIYGMAGLALEMIHRRGISLKVEIIPGVSAASSLGARLGAPLMLDFACISLSDILVPWEQIQKRVQAIAQADMVLVLYNPRSKKRTHQLQWVHETMLSIRNGQTIVGVGTDISLPEEKIEFTTLQNLLDLEINMRSTIVIGNSSTCRLGPYMVTPRGYSLGE